MWTLSFFFLLCFVKGSFQVSDSFELVVGLPLNNLTELEKLFWEIADPSSSEYLHFRSVAEIGQLIGATQEDIDITINWLVSLGAQVSTIRVSKLRDTITSSFDSTPLSSKIWSNQGIPSINHHPIKFDFVLRRDFHISSIRRENNQSPKKLSSGYDIASQKKAYQLPTDYQASNDKTLQMVWGPGTFGYSPQSLARFKSEECPLLNLDKVEFDTEHHGTPGGDNWGEGNLDTQMITAMGLNVRTLVSNTNTSSSTEEGEGFGQALLDWAVSLSSRTKNVPQVISMSLGSLSAYSCDLLCSEAAKKGHKLSDCKAFMQEQRQVCMYLSQDQVGRINTAFQVLGTRGVTLFGSSGDGGSHYSFGPFPSRTQLGKDLNVICCQFQFPVFPTGSPYVVSVGGTQWKNRDPSRPVAWSRSGGGFSWQFKQPAHQNKTVAAYLSSTSDLPPKSSFNQAARAYPDVSAVAVEGTSESSPTIAGIFSLINDYRFNKGLSPLGYLSPRLWQVMEKYPGEAFFDVTEGNTACGCDNGFPVTKGWDPMTGWGRPIWPGLLKHFGTDDLLDL